MLNRGLLALVLVTAFVGCHHTTGGGNGNPPDEGVAGDLGPGADLAGVTQDLAGSSSGDMAMSCATAISCASAGANCGPIADGCGGVVQCGTCGANETCGGGGTPSVCGTACTPTTCAALGVNCGTQSDGCGGTLACGTCTGNETCGGGGTPSVCGTPVAMCVPTTCAALGVNCGTQSDGCGGTLSCGTCTGSQTCGGGGTPSVCGTAACVPKTCTAGLCGPTADGCGGLIQCGGCSEPMTCGGGGATPGMCSTPSSCTGLCTKQQTCADPTKTTTVSGVVYAPNGTDPLPNVLVYIPNATVAAFTPGVACEQCGDSVSGSPLVTATSDAAGKFTLSNAPVGTNIPLVIQTGRWRRQTVIPTVSSCVDNPQPVSLTRLPKTQSEGDIPLMAFATGGVDSLECVLRKIGVADTEFTAPSGTGRIRLYVGDGSYDANGAGTGPLGGAHIKNDTTSESVLVAPSGTAGVAPEISKYDMVFFPCKGEAHARTTNELKNVLAYANAGGRIFATHYSYDFLSSATTFASAASWDAEYCDPATSTYHNGTITTCYGPNDPQTGYIDQTFPKGLLLAEWLVNVGASTAMTIGQIAINTLRLDVMSVMGATQSWMTIHEMGNGTTFQPPMHITFNTPIGATAANQCGRVLYDDFHVENQSGDYGDVFPAECPAAGTALTPQEKLLEFMIFDLGSCVTPDVPQCTPATCTSQNIGCGPAGDGCGGSIDCGTCPMGQSCGGGGTPSQCGAPTCKPETCASQNLTCGTAGDGCGGMLNCGMCTAPLTCGGGGTPGVCGSGSCTPTTCAAQHISCGPAGDGCGGSLSCGTCPTGQSCGGAGVPGQCGSLCTPKTCASLGYNCGAAGDGCGNQLDCGTCTLPATCGGAGTPNVCGGGIQ